MFKNLLIIFVLMIGLVAHAATNSLNTVVVSKTDNITSIILRCDEVTKVKKEVVSDDKMILTLKNVVQAENINMFYKNITDVSGLIIQDDGNGDLKVFVEAPEISKANIVFETPNSSPITVINTSNKDMTFWGIALIILLGMFVKVLKSFFRESNTDYDPDELIKEREKALYKSFQREVSAIPSINYKLKGYRKHVLKGETIRSYESRMSKI